MLADFPDVDELNDEWVIRPMTGTDLPERLEKYFPQMDALFLPATEAPDLPPRCVSYEKAEEFAKTVTFDGKDGFYYSHLSGRFIFGDLVEAVFVEQNWHTKELVIATLSLDENNIDSLVNLFEGKYIDSLFLMVSYFHYNSKRSTLEPYIKERLGNYDFQLCVVREHYKHALFTTDCGKHIGLRGTANMMSCDCYETVFVHNDNRLNAYDMKMFAAMHEIYRITSPKKKGQVKHIGGLKTWRMVVQATEKKPI